MSTDRTDTETADPAAVMGSLQAFLAARLRTDVHPDQELFSSGLVSSMFAMQLVVHLEETFGIEIDGPDLKLGNFATVRAMSELVGRLRAAAGR